jgi:hypothetical protein
MLLGERITNIFEYVIHRMPVSNNIDSILRHMSVACSVRDGLSSPRAALASYVVLLKLATELVVHLVSFAAENKVQVPFPSPGA